MRHAASIAVWLAFATVAPAWAHDRGVTQLDLTLDGARVHATLRTHPADPIEPALYVRDQLEVRADGAACQPTLPEAGLADGDRIVRVTFVCDDAPIELRLLVYGIKPREQVIARIEGAGRIAQRVLTESEREVIWYAPEPKLLRRTRWWPGTLVSLVSLVSLAVAFFAGVAFLIAKRSRARSP